MARELSNYLKELKSENAALVNLLLQAKAAAGIHDDERAVGLISEIIPGFDKKMLLDIEDRKQPISFEVAQAMIKVYEPDKELNKEILFNSAYRKLKREFETDGSKQQIGPQVSASVAAADVQVNISPSLQTRNITSISETARKEMEDYIEIITTSKPSTKTIKLTIDRWAERVIRRDKTPQELIDETRKALRTEFEKELEPFFLKIKKHELIAGIVGSLTEYTTERERLPTIGRTISAVKERAENKEQQLLAELESLSLGAALRLLRKRTGLSKHDVEDLIKRDPIVLENSKYLPKKKSLDKLLDLYEASEKVRGLIYKKHAYEVKEQQNKIIEKTLKEKGLDKKSSDLSYENILLKLRIKSGHTAAYMADKVGFAAATLYSRYERGERIFSPEHLAKAVYEFRNTAPVDDIKNLLDKWLEVKINAENKRSVRGNIHLSIDERKLNLMSDYRKAYESTETLNKQNATTFQNTEQHLGLATKRLSEERRVGRTRQ